MSRSGPAKVVWLDGRVFSGARARISVFDRGLLYGDAAFETVRIYSGAPYRWREHRRRLIGTLRLLSIPRPQVDLEAAIREVVGAADLREGSVRLTITRGVGEGLAPPPGLTPTVLLIPRPIPMGLDLARADGVRVIRLPFGQGRFGFTSGHKTTSYAAAVQGRIRARRARAFEALYVEENGGLSEATTSNVFVVRRSQVFTPPLDAGCLPGITRDLVLHLARRQGLTMDERALTATDLDGADECFLTGSVIEIVPVVRVDDVDIGGGTPGSITRGLQTAYAREVQRFRRKVARASESA